ncbi:hypothetical protein EGW08_008003 [Elysia chlorotica]|uniref:FAD dependent oxidoreductase domain-containing protein n=1 Tax=Elysia chlorotica TaxID=188477 RepID=A0A3S1BI75_ELYCH|nr:hypothetical protein EGW08_008003 [Elysia chlorotica]
MSPRIVVLGAGINGLSSAVCVQQACPLAQVQLVSEHFSPDTTGDGSAGFWMPHLMSDKSADMVKRVSAVTYEHLVKLAYSPLAGDLKIQMLSGYNLSSNPVEGPEEVPVFSESLESYRKLTEKEMRRFPKDKHGVFFTTVSVDVTPYLAWLMKRFKDQGGTIKQARIENIEEIAQDCDILINCCGLSSRHLFKDEKIKPVRGQVWKVKAPWIKHFYIFDEHLSEHPYILPGVDFVTVGGTAQAGDWNTQSDPEDARRIWNNAVERFPPLRHATPLRSWAGLRPWREIPRLEAEAMAVHGRNIQVIHNYGHGGSGVTMHWGCALEVTTMVLQALGTPPDQIERLVSRL